MFTFYLSSLHCSCNSALNPLLQPLNVGDYLERVLELCAKCGEMLLVVTGNSSPSPGPELRRAVARLGWGRPMAHTHHNIETPLSRTALILTL